MMSLNKDYVKEGDNGNSDRWLKPNETRRVLTNNLQMLNMCLHIANVSACVVSVLKCD